MEEVKKPWRFQPGVVSNPHGRPPGTESAKRQIQEGLIQALKERTNNKGKDQTRFDAIVENLLDDAAKGKGRAQELVSGLLFQQNTLSDYDDWLNRGKDDDLDYRLFRIYKRAFDIQQQVLLSKEKRIYLMCGRRAGKTIVNELKLIYTMVELASDTPVRRISEKPVKVLYIGLTITKAIDLIYDHMKDLCWKLKIPVETFRRNEGYMKMANGSELFIAGNASSAEREKARGPYWDLVIIDEVQSHDNATLKYYLESILEPTLIDTKGTLMMSGTGPRTRGMLWGQIWENVDNRWPGLRLNWNLFSNPHINDHQLVLEQVLREHNWTENSNAYVREYLGKVSYDDDALVYRLSDKNYYTNEELIAWVNAQPITDIRFTAGLDYGFVSADAFVMVMWSISSPLRFIISEYKKSRTGWNELIDAIKNKINEIVKNPVFDRKELVAPNDPGWEMTDTLNTTQMQYAKPQLVTIGKNFAVWAEYATGGQKTAIDFRKEGIPIVDAIKTNKQQKVELLREEVLSRNLKCHAVRQPDGSLKTDSIFAEEALYTVFSRDEQDQLTREIDDLVFHPDLCDSLLYAYHPIFASKGIK